MPKKTARSGGQPGASSAWNLNEIRELMDVLDERQISEFEMEKGGFRIRIKRGGNQAEGFSALPSVDHRAPSRRAVPPPEPLEPLPPAEKVASPEPAESSEELHLVKSPIVGTYYSAPSPNAPPFVKAGDEVEVGQPLCIIEAMKLMNEIEAEVAGEVVRVYVENGQPVEYGQALFAIRPSHKI